MSFLFFPNIKERFFKEDKRDKLIDLHFDLVEKLQKNAKRQMAITEEVYQRVHRLEALTKQIYEKVTEMPDISKGQSFCAQLSREQISEFVDFYSHPSLISDPQFNEMRTNVLSWFGLKEVAKIGEIYHPQYAQVLEAVPSYAEEFPSGSVVDIVEQGFFVAETNKLIRPAKVIVAKSENNL